ncbi:hypothetical protein PR202_ga16570 [Eleusine coracana subsp. coracana]|uniref:non-specific serine/threonine protein kinase n=1 Tax=Eleusine coracana subsp. coracana TaxID=191504 RepID=A0AAV5CM22_ELECO|nr:hypothetical protein PR202_ga16570 [Eleusine coracana subsp. coracana]
MRSDANVPGSYQGKAKAMDLILGEGDANPVANPNCMKVRPSEDPGDGVHEKLEKYLTRGAMPPGDGRVLWTPNTPPAAAAVLLNTGNLVIRSTNGTTVWQSFDHPTDTFLPGMKIRVRYKTHTGERTVSWKGHDDPSPGSFSFGIDPTAFLQTFIWNGTLPMARTPPWTGYLVNGGQLQVNSSIILYMAIVSNEEEFYVTYSLSDGSSRTRYVLTFSGEHRLETWRSSAWAVDGKWPANICSRYGYCGPYGFCDNTEAIPTCKCLDGFEPTSFEDWKNGKFSQGCRRKRALRCDDGFLALPLMKSPDKFVLLENRTYEECEAECTRNCSCVAYAYSNVTASRSARDTTRCLVWSGELIDTEKIGNTAGGDKLYLRIAGLAAAGTGRKTNALAIVLSIVLTSCTAIVAVMFLACFKDNSRKTLLDWPTRYNIIKGISRGLLYLHQDSRLTIIHRDLKAANVLLDAEMRPKIADFGMARIFSDSENNANTERVVGT